MPPKKSKRDEDEADGNGVVVHWAWRKDGEYVRYDRAVEVKIEQAFNLHPRPMKVPLDTERFIDLTAMQQVRFDDATRTRSVQRTAFGRVTAPPSGKKAKVAAAAGSAPATAGKTCVGMALAGCHVCFTGACSQPRAALTAIVLQHGGTVAKSMSKTVTHLVAATAGTGKFDSAGGKGTCVVREEWLWESIKAGRPLPAKKFEFGGDNDEDEEEEEKEEEEDEEKEEGISLQQIAGHKFKAYTPQLSFAESLLPKASKFGGLPCRGPGDTWPVCPGCKHKMGFHAQVNLDDLPISLSHVYGPGVLQVFMCDQGCDTGQPFNPHTMVRILKTKKEMLLAQPPTGQTPKIHPPQTVDSWTPRDDYPSFWELDDLEPGIKLSDNPEKENGYDFPIRGYKIGGWPAWAAHPEYPECVTCSEQMSNAILQYDDGNTDFIVTQCPTHLDVVTISCIRPCS